jgi:hypothetical protein
MADLCKALLHNPFEGDFGDQGDRELRDKIVTFRKSRTCHCCAQDVKPGTMGRSLTMLWASDGPMSYAYCHECTKAQAKSWDDDGRALDKRFALRWRSRAPVGNSRGSASE